MKDFLINHIGDIGSIFGIIILLIILISNSYWAGTKYEIICNWYILIMIGVGVTVSGAEIAKWIFK